MPDPLKHSGRWRWRLSVDTLVLLAGVYWAVTANAALARAALRDRPLDDFSTWHFAIALAVMLVALHVLLLGLVAHRWTIKPIVAVLTVAAAAGAYYMDAYGVVLDPSMLRNVLRTDVAEAHELLSPRLLVHLLLHAGLPLLLLWRVQLVQRPWRRAVASRMVLLVTALAAVALATWSIFQPLASWTRNDREVRYLATPLNLLWSTGKVLASDAKSAGRPRQAIGLDAKPGPSWAQRQRPLVVVYVVGETVRAANWGLSGYARATTPQLASWPVVNFANMESCGTNTEVSLPCMFAPVGRRDHDEERIRGQESLLHVVARAGVGVHWRDNQSGCKGVCDGLPSETVSAQTAPGLCQAGRCLDEALVSDLDQRLKQARGTQLWVLHMLGNHGPSYFRRYPESFAKFTPECRHDDLRQCSIPQIVNAYDNAILYTDHLLAKALTVLRARAGEVDSALVYVSDHGESLGERGLFLHGVPYRIAPKEQTQIPMVMWASEGFERAAGLTPGCFEGPLKARAQQPATHDHLFHSVLSLLDVRTSLHDRAWDLLAACRASPP